MGEDRSAVYASGSTLAPLRLHPERLREPPERFRMLQKSFRRFWKRFGRSENRSGCSKSLSGASGSVLDAPKVVSEAPEAFWKVPEGFWKLRKRFRRLGKRFGKSQSEPARSRKEVPGAWRRGGQSASTRRPTAPPGPTPPGRAARRSRARGAPGRRPAEARRERRGCGTSRPYGRGRGGRFRKRVAPRAKLDSSSATHSPEIYLRAEVRTEPTFAPSGLSFLRFT